MPNTQKRVEEIVEKLFDAGKRYGEDLNYAKDEALYELRSESIREAVEALSQQEKEVKEEIVGIIKSKLPDEMSQEEMEKYHCEASMLHWGKKLLQTLQKD